MKQSKKQAGITIFYSSASVDNKWRDQLADHLSQLKHDGLIEEWSDEHILAGSDRAQAIEQAIRSADIILLLISADFLASDTCYQEDMQHALDGNLGATSTDFEEPCKKSAQIIGIDAS